MKDSVEVPFILFFEADEDTLVARIMERSKTSGRNDDNEESLRKRLRTFTEVTMPIVNFYED
jgi:UMP-CMP kinase